MIQSSTQRNVEIRCLDGRIWDEDREANLDKASAHHFQIQDGENVPNGALSVVLRPLLASTTKSSRAETRSKKALMSKRAASPPANGALIKRARATPPPSNQIAISSTDDRSKGLIRTVQRTSSLDAPIVSLAGAHAVRFLFSFV